MPNVVLPIDSERITLIGTGKVAAAFAWVDGKRSDQQKRDPDTGMPMWIIDAVIDDDSARSATAGIEVPAGIDEPKIAKWRPVQFRGLSVSIYVDRAGRLGMRWSADELVAESTTASRPSVVA
jgi:hypothetical protein